MAFKKDVTGLPNLGSNATTMLVSGEGTATNDIVQDSSIIQLVQR